MAARFYKFARLRLRRPHRWVCEAASGSLLILLVLFARQVSAQDFLKADHPRDFSFPRDHGRHDGFKIEWWYFTGNLHDSTGRKFGYELTFFRSQLQPDAKVRQSPWAMNNLYFAHAAITDVDGKRFIFKDRLQRARPEAAWSSDSNLDVNILDWQARLQDGRITLKASSDALAIELNCSEGRGPFLEGPGGVNAKGKEAGQASYYYSMTRLKTSGKLSIGGKSYTVDGLTWMDHEFSTNSLSKDQVGWDWMGLQLADGSDLIIYRMRNRTGKTDYLSGTRVEVDGQPHYLTANDIQLLGSNPSKSEISGANYPQVWSLKVKGLEPMTVRSDLPGQELNTKESTDVSYFEGAVDVLNGSEKSVGQGYLEMTGYDKAITGNEK